MKPYFHKLFDRLQESDGAAPPAALLKGLAAVLALFYGLGARARRGLYSRRFLKAKRLPAPVVSVGNLTVGGTGKTPLAAHLARLFQERGQRVAILSRGYRGHRPGVTRVSNGSQISLRPPEVGEEAYWLAQALPGVGVYTGASRYQAGIAAWEELKPDLFLLDDGFQHFQLHRDLDIVLLDAASPFGNGSLLPRGPLREPASALSAADLLILTRFEEGHQAQLQAIKINFPGKTVLTAAISPTAARYYPGGEEQPPEVLKGQALFAFAGLARPQVFTQTLKELDVDLKGSRAFPDHHSFTNDDLIMLVREARAFEATALITTGKDWARLGDKWEADLPLWVLEVEARLGQPLPGKVMESVLGGGPGT